MGNTMSDVVHGLETGVTNPSKIFTGEVFFPDNDNRKKRVEELHGDVSLLVAENGVAYKGIQDSAASIDSALKGYGIDPANIPTSTGQQADVLGDFKEQLAPLGPAGVAVLAECYYVLPALSLASLCQRSSFDTKALELLGTTLAAAATITVPGAGLVISGVLQGQTARDSLQQNIKECVSVRKKLQESKLVNVAMQKVFDSVLTGLEAVMSVKKPQEKVIAYLRSRTAASVQQEVANHNFETEAGQVLHDIDARRQSWTNED